MSSLIRNFASSNPQIKLIMKRYLFPLFLLLAGACAFAQKSYVTVYCTQDNSNAIVLSGDIPKSMNRYYLPYEFDEYNGYYCIGEVLNLLATNGFSVEQMNTTHNKDEMVITTYLLSKPSEGQNPDAIPQTKAKDDSKVREVARYNLQGMPVGKDEKGVQIVVYSNYTTKTVIEE